MNDKIKACCENCDKCDKTLEEVNNFLKRAWQKLGGVK